MRDLGQARLEPFNPALWSFVRHPRRGEIWVECRAIAGNTGATLWYGMLSDITPRKQAEANLRRSEELCRVPDRTPDRCRTCTRGWTDPLVNSAALACFGIQRG